MKMKIILTLLIISTFYSVKGDKDIIPLFLLDYNNVMDHIMVEPNPFYKLSTAFFANIVHDAIKKSQIVIVFLEDQFSVEDISMRDRLGSAYHHLHLGLLDGKVKYFPKIIEPYKLLNQIFQPLPFNVFYLSSGTKAQMFQERYNHYYVYFQDFKNETRANALRRHDLLIKEVYSAVCQLARGPVVAFYTGKMNPVQVEKIEFIPISPLAAPKYPGVMVISDGALFKFAGVFAATNTRRALFNQVPMVARETRTSGGLSTKMAYIDFELEFNFSFKHDHWLLDNVALLEGGEEVGKTVMAVGARWDWAYYCGEPLVVVNTRDGSSVTISEYKIQPMRLRKRFYNSQAAQLNEGNGTDGPNHRRYGREGDEDSAEAGQEEAGDSTGSGKFGDSVNCGPYFSSGILACLFVTGICLSIASIGLMVLMDCNTSDRYEDPHGKQLVIGIEN